MRVMPESGDLDLLVAAGREAAALALTYFGQDPRSWPKGAASIVSEADFAVDRLLADRLLAARPDYGWLSEETADNPDRLGRHRTFVVDPIDGTRAFLSGRREWCVSLAVVEAGRPVTAVLLTPALGGLYRAAAGAGADLDGRRLTTSGRGELAGARFAGPRRFARPAAEAAGVPIKAVRFVPSLAYRIALVASGEIDVAISGPNAHDWDIAAADLLVHEAGGTFSDLAGRKPRYNRAEITHPVLVASARGIAGEVTALIAGWHSEESEAS
jgi:myo-inositol-1(or 4)-monophosphatase